MKHSQIDWATDPVVSVSESPYSLKPQIQQHAGDRWLISVSLPIATREDAAPWIAFFQKLYGKRGTFYYGSILGDAPLGPGGGTPLVAGAGQSGATLNIDGATSSTQFLKAGDFFQIDNSLYMNLNDVSANGGGACTLDIRPRLRGHADNAPLILANPKGVFRLTENRSGWSEGQSKHYLVSFTAQEAL